LVRTKTVFKDISVNDANGSLHLINHVHQEKEYIPIVLFVVKQLFFTMTILITQTSVAVTKNATILFEYQN